MPEVATFALIPLGFILVGVLLVVAGIRGWRLHGDFERRATARARATVMEIRYERVGRRGSSITVPVVGFDLPDGRRVEARAMAVSYPGVSWRREGAVVDVVYDPNDPTDVAVEGASGGRLLHGFLIGFGALFALMGLLGLGVGLLLANLAASGG